MTAALHQHLRYDRLADHRRRSLRNDPEVLLEIRIAARAPLSAAGKKSDAKRRDDDPMTVFHHAPRIHEIGYQETDLVPLSAVMVAVVENEGTNSANTTRPP
jgi:hypothetical protein